MPLSFLAIMTSAPFMLALVAMLPNVRHFQITLTWFLTGVMGLLFVLFLAFIPQVAEGAVIFQVAWVEALGLNFTLYLDGLSLLFALLVTGIGTAVVVYTGYYFDDGDSAARFYTRLLAFVGAMLALVLAGNVLTLFIAWELTSILSFLLISFYGDKDEAARIGAIRALVITGGGGLALLVGLLLLATAAGSPEFGVILTTANLQDHAWYNGIALLIMLACFTKSAQFPFHFWLPGAMSAPSPASAFLHSATMVKAGVYLLLRMLPVLGDTPLWLNMLMGVGLTTMFIGGFFALRQRDLKALLAYSTISSLGGLVALIGLPEAHGLKAALIGVTAHALYKATLFLLTGTIEHATGTRSLNALGGLRQHMPGGAIIAGVVSLSMLGVPPLLGYLAKETLLDAMLPNAPLTLLPIVIVFAGSVFTGIVALLFLWEVFLRPLPANSHLFDHYHAPSIGLQLGPALMAGASLLLGITLNQTIVPLVNLSLEQDVSLYLIPPDGLANRAFQLSLLVLVAAPLLFSLRRYWLRLPELRLPRGIDVYTYLINRINSIGDLFLRSQSGRVRNYLALILASLAGFILLANATFTDIFNLSDLRFEFPNPAVDVLRVTLLLLALGAGVATIVFKQHLLAALAMGMLGYSVGGLFLLEPAPDVALVQFLVETMGTVLIILMITRISLKQRERMIAITYTSRPRIIRDIIISTTVGTAVGLFALSAVVNRPATLELSAPISLWHLQNSYGELGITDVVGGIVTDFRGTDTLLEITVFSVAALGVMTILTLPQAGELLLGHPLDKLQRSIVLSNPEDELETEQDERAKSRLSTPLTRLVARLTLPFALLIAFAHILYGGTAPGDGFTAGIVVGLIVALWYVIFGYFEARESLNWLVPGRLIVVGLLLALANALVPVLIGSEFLRIQNFGDAPAGLHLASTTIFELSIFLTVLGGVSTIMEAIAHPREIQQEFYGEDADE